MKLLITIICLFGLLIYSFGQSEKTIRNLGIEKKETWNNTGKTRFLETRQLFDQKGNLLEIIEYNNDRSFKRHVVNTYNKSNDKITETELDASGKIIKRIDYEYDGKLRVSRKVYNNRDRLISHKTYEYSFREREGE